MNFVLVAMDHLCIQGFAVILMVLYPGTLAVPLGEVTTPEITRGRNGKMTLRFSTLGMNLEFHLNPDDGFLRPGVNIGRVRRAGEEEEGVDGLRSCFYSSQEPFAAFSMCKGVQGAFLHGQDSYIIQPTDKWTGQGPLGQHLIFKARNGDTESWGSRTVENNQEEIKNPEQKSAGASGEKIKNTRGGKQDLNAGEEPHDGDQVPPRLSERDGGDVQGQGPLEGSRGDRNPNISQRQTQTWTTLEKSKNGTERSRAARPRNRRFVSVDRFVEILLVADTSMVQFYGEDLKLHLLTLMSVAARIYKHPSLQNSVSLVVVKVLVVEDEDAGPDVSDNAGLTLRNFCNWQQGFNPPSDRHSEHYDTAILLTRQDFCGHKSCDTLGVADIGTVCDPSKSCSVIEDDGLQASYTLAHELAHVLSIPHDNSKNCEKTFGELGQHHLMAPLFLQLNKSVPWSPCSAMHLTEFFDSGYGGCLLDAPTVTLELPEDLPGSLFLYDLDSQCGQVFGKEFSHCPNTHQKDVCAQLWCKIEGEHVCHTKNGSLHWADGTACGDHRLCLDGVCVDEQSYAKPKVPVDGNWGSWGPWGECSRTCGGGVRFSYRECNSPEPQNGGRYCNGQRVLYESCNTDECPAQDQSFREQQCAKYNRVSSDVDGRALEWIPKYSGVSPRDRCKLVCRARGTSEFKVFQSKVVDGTLCGPESLSVCVQGQCIKAGCDHVLGSSKKLDKCARCGGDGSTCRKISGSFNKSNVRYGYNDIVHIPVGATNIDIKQSRERGLLHHSNYLAIKKADESYLLNGDFVVSSMEQDLHLKGTILKYSGSSTKLERIQSFSPLPEPLTIQLLRGFGETVPLKVKYTFYVPKALPYARTKVKKKEKVSHHSIRPLLTSNWVFGDWSQCSKTCGSGWQRRTVECQNVEGGASDQCSQELRPEDIQPCSKLPCPIWRVGSWSPCSKSCGEGTRTKRVFCADYTGKETDADKCDPKKRPAEELTSCMLDEC